MTTRLMRLTMAMLWLGLAFYAFAFGPIAGPIGPYLPWFALILGLYDLARWWSQRPKSLPPVPPNRRRRPHDAPPQHEYNPEFDFRLQQDDGRT